MIAVHAAPAGLVCRSAMLGTCGQRALFASALSCPALGRQIVTKKKGKTGKLDLLCKTAKGSTCLCAGLYKSLGVLSVVGGQCAGPSPKEALGPREQQKGACKKQRQEAAGNRKLRSRRKKLGC